jgi:hypothetical protein
MMCASALIEPTAPHVLFGAGDFDFGSRSAPFEGAATHKASGSAGGYLHHGYAVTSHSSQGQTADRVLIHVHTDLAAKDVLNNRMAYVSVSRGQWDAQIFTNDRSALANALGHDVSHQSAINHSRLLPQRLFGMSPRPNSATSVQV